MTQPLVAVELFVEGAHPPSTPEVELAERELARSERVLCRLVVAGRCGLDGRQLPPSRWCVLGVVALDEHRLRHEIARCEGAIERTAAVVAQRLGLLGLDGHWTETGTRFVHAVDRAVSASFGDALRTGEACEASALAATVGGAIAGAVTICRALASRFQVTAALVSSSAAASRAVLSALAAGGCEWGTTTANSSEIGVDFLLPGRFDTIAHAGPCIRVIPATEERWHVQVSTPSSTDLVDGLTARLLERSRGRLPPWAAPLLARVVPSRRADRAVVHDLVQALDTAALPVDCDECTESATFRTRRAFEHGAAFAVIVSRLGGFALRTADGQEEERFDRVDDVVARLGRAASFPLRG